MALILFVCLWAALGVMLCAVLFVAAVEIVDSIGERLAVRAGAVGIASVVTALTWVMFSS